MKTAQIKEFVQKWIEGHDPDTFLRNKNGVIIYSAGPSSLNLEAFFENLLEDFIDEHSSQFNPNNPTIDKMYGGEELVIIIRKMLKDESIHYHYVREWLEQKKYIKPLPTNP